MRWYEYKMEVDDLHASDDLKAKLLAMQPAEEAPKPARKPKKAIHFPRKTLSIAACGLLCGVGLYAAVHSPFSLLPAGGAALSSAPETASYAAAYSMDDVNSALAAPKMAVPAGGSADAMSDRDAGGTGTLSAEAAQTSTKLIYTANLTIESKDFDAARTALTDAVSAAGGYLESSNESSYTGSSRTLSLTIRVPQDNYASFLEAAAQAGNLVDKSEQVQDVTTQYMDIEARLSNLTAQRTRLQELQASAENLSDLLEIESSLSDVQYQIESWQSQLDWYSQQVSCSTVYLSLDEVKEYTPHRGILPLPAVQRPPQWLDGLRLRHPAADGLGRGRLARAGRSGRSRPRRPLRAPPHPQVIFTLSKRPGMGRFLFPAAAFSKKSYSF